MQLIDTHCHLYSQEFDNIREQTIQRAKENNIYKVFLPTTEKQSVDDMLKTYSMDKQFFVPYVGLYPGSVDKGFESQLQAIEPYLKDERIKGIGEIGLDFYWNRDYEQEQLLAFEKQIIWSKQYNDLPMSIHARKAVQESYLLLKKLNYKTYNGVFHCYSGELNMANKLIEMGFKLGIGGVLTYKNSHLVDIVKNIDLKNLVLETDAPYLSPVPYRGKINEPMYINIIAQYIAQIKEISLQQVAEQTTSNALQLIEK